jgi:hypothetical protein
MFEPITAPKGRNSGSCFQIPLLCLVAFFLLFVLSPGALGLADAFQPINTTRHAFLFKPGTYDVGALIDNGAQPVFGRP